MDRSFQIAGQAGKEAITAGYNFVYSPPAIRASLALVAAGAKGATLQELLDFLGFRSLAELNAASTRRVDNFLSWPQLNFAAGIFVDRTVVLRPEFVSAAASVHRAFARSLDFRNRADPAVAQVNAFVREATYGRMSGIITAGSLRHSTGGVVASTVHFKAAWSQAFDTRDGVFHRLDGTSVRVPFMASYEDQYISRFDGGFKVLQSFYKMVGRDGQLHWSAPCFCMLIFLPDDKQGGLENLLRAVATMPDFVMRHVPRREKKVRRCMVPKFRFSYEFDAVGALEKLGLTAPFGVKADLSGTVASMPPWDAPLRVSQLRHMAEIDLNEEGTTTATVTTGCLSQQQAETEFVANRPFLFAIVEYEKGEVVYIGHVLDPSQGMPW